MSTVNFVQNKAPSISIEGALFYIVASKFNFQILHVRWRIREDSNL